MKPAVLRVLVRAKIPNIRVKPFLKINLPFSNPLTFFFHLQVLFCFIAEYLTNTLPSTQLVSNLILTLTDQYLY